MRRFALMGAIATALLGAGVTAAIATSGPSTTPILARFVLATTEQSGTECQGSDGKYFQGSVTQSGPIRASDARLNGTLQIINDTLENEDTGFGSGSGTFTITSHGSVTVSGEFWIVGGPGGTKGVATGQLSDGSSMVASLSSITDGQGVVHGELGASRTTVLSDPAIIQAGSC